MATRVVPPPTHILKAEKGKKAGGIKQYLVSGQLVSDQAVQAAEVIISAKKNAAVRRVVVETTKPKTPVKNTVLGYSVTHSDDDDGLVFVEISGNNKTRLIGKHVPSIDMHTYISHGFYPKVFKFVSKSLELSNTEFAKYLHIPTRTYERRIKETKPMPVDDSAKAARVASIVMIATEVFEDEKSAAIWLKTPNETLNSKKPLELLSTDAGTEVVRDLLNRIEHGIFS